MSEQPGASSDPERVESGADGTTDRPPDAASRPTEPSGFLALPDDLPIPTNSESMQLRAALPSHRFTPGQVLAGRYKVKRLIASGGMGSVYEVEDRHLRCRVALKSVLWFMAGEPMGVERLRREIQLARRVTHPNVCRLFDLGSHHAGDDEGEILFLTMELLDGETLSSRIRRTGPLSLAEALPLAKQMASALAAAHEAGVVHRDFKSPNIMIVPRRSSGAQSSTNREAPDAQDDSSELRAVVTDFGLARSSEPLDGVSLTGSGAVLGTPSYMAPEQLQGEKASPASDIYALGLVMYEMTTGRLPFLEKTPMAAVTRRLKEDPPSPREFRPDLPAPWADLILRCLEREPASRFPNAAAIVDALDAVRFALGSSAGATNKAVVAAPPAPVRAHGRRWQAPVTGVALLLLGAAGLWYWQTTDIRQQNAPQTVAGGLSQTRRSIAVLGFRNLSGRPEAAWLSTALSEMLGTDLAAGEQLRIISAEEVARVKRELGLSDAEPYTAEALKSIRRNLNADFVLMGSFEDLGQRPGGQVRLQLQLQDAASGQTVLSTAENGSESDLFGLVARVGRALRQKFRVKEPPTDVSGQVLSSMPKTADAARYHAEGLEKLRVFDAVAARDLQSQAVASDPNFALAHLALADAWAALGYRETSAKESARRAFELSEGLPRAERLLIEGAYRLYNGEPDAAVVSYQALHTFFPDDIDYGLALARAQVAARKPADSLKTLTDLRKPPTPASDDPRIDLEEANAYLELPDFEKSRDAASRAVEKARALGSRLLLADARWREGLALRALARNEEAKTALEESKALFAEAGDHFRVAACLQELASLDAVRAQP